MQRIFLLFLMLVVMVVVSGCSDEQAEGSVSIVDGEAVLAVNAEMFGADELVAIESIEGNITSGGQLRFSSAVDVSDWQKDEVKIIPPSDNLPGGMALKVVSVTEGINGSMVRYVTPTIDEVFQETSFSISSAVTKSMVKSVSMRQGVGVDFGVDQAPLYRAGTWFPEEGTAFTHGESGVVSGDGGVNIAHINMHFDSLVYENTEGNKNEKFELSGDYNLTDLKVVYTYEHALIPLKLKSDFNLTYNSQTSLKSELVLSIDDSMVNHVPKKFECGGLVIDKSGDKYSVKISGAEFGESDICLGYVSLELSAVPVKASVGGKAVTDAPIGIRLFFIMGADMKVSIVTGLSLSKSQYNDMGINVDSQAKKKLTAWRKEYVSKDNQTAPVWNKSIYGEMQGKLSTYSGVAAAPFVLGIYPMITRAYAGPKLKGSVTAGYGTTSGLNVCSDISLDLEYGFDASVFIGADLTLGNDDTWLKLEKNKSLAYSYLIANSSNLYNYNSCQSDGYSVTFVNPPQGLNGFRVNNLDIKDSTNHKVTPQALTYNIYHNGTLVNTNTSLEALVSGLAAGAYEIETIILIDSARAIKVSLKGDYHVNAVFDKYDGMWIENPDDPESTPVKFTGTKTGVDFELYEDFLEDGSLYRYIVVGKFIIEGTKRVQPNNIEVDKVTLSMTDCNLELTPKTTDAVNNLNNNQICGKTDWMINITVDASDCITLDDNETIRESCELDTSKGLLYKEGNKLYIGDDESLLDADGYPSALDTTNYMQKQ